MSFNRFALLAAFLLVASSVHAQDKKKKINFEDHVKPIFRAKCASCHNTNKKTADLDVTNYTALMQGGGSGAAIEPGSPDDSYLFMVINHDTEPYMPPESDKLPDEMIQTVKTWIELGAPETSTSKVTLPKKEKVNLSVDVAAGARPEGPPPLPDVLSLEPVVHTEATTAVSAIATSPWAKLIAVAGQKQVILYSSETLQPLGVLPFPEGQARVLKFSRTGGLLLAGGGHGAAKGLAVVWNVRTGDRVMEVGDELDEVLAADISADQSMVALGGPGKIVRVYSTATGELAYEIVKHTDWIYSLEFSPDSVLLATGDRVGGLHVWEAYTGRQYLTLNGHKGAINSVSWRIDSNVLASASSDAAVKLWEMENGRNIKSWNAHGGGTESMEFCRDGRIVTCGRDRTTKIFDQNGAQQRAFEAFGDLALRVSHCDETNRVIAGDWTGEIRVWKVEDGARVGNLTTNPPLLQARVTAAEAAVTPLRQKLATASTGLDTASKAKAAHVKVIDTAKAAYATATNTLADRKKGLESQKTQLETEKKAQALKQQHLAKLQKAVPQLKAAADSAAAVLELMKDDAELKKAVEAIQGHHKKRSEELTKTDAEYKAQTANVTKWTGIVDATTKQIPVDEKQVAATKAELDKQTAALKPFDEKVAAAQGVVNAAQAEVNTAVATVARWKEYVALRDELTALAQKKTARDEVLLASLEADAELKEKTDGIAASQQVVSTRTKEIADSTQKKKDLTTAIDGYSKELTGVKDMIGRHEKAIPALQNAVAQAKAALASLPADAELKAAADMLTKTVTAKTTGLEQLKARMAATDKQMKDSQTALTGVNTAITAAQKEMTTHQAMVKKLTEEAAPIQKAADEAKTKLTAAEGELAKAQALVDARKEKLRPQLQVTQAAR